MNIMTKFGDKINRPTHEHICDTVEDLKNIDKTERDFGSIAIVLKGQNGIEVYMSDSKGEWVLV